MARASSPYVGVEDGDLSFPMGALLLVLRRDESGWFECRFVDDVGVAPSNHIREVPLAELRSIACARARTLYSRTKELAPADASELGFGAGEVLQLLDDEPSNGWLLALRENDGAVGYVPATFVAVEALEGGAKGAAQATLATSVSAQEGVSPTLIPATPVATAAAAAAPAAEAAPATGGPPSPATDQLEGLFRDIRAYDGRSRLRSREAASPN